jgi:PKD repeat protein
MWPVSSLRSVVLILNFACLSLQILAQCGIVPVSLDQRIGDSNLIVEGWVSGQEAYMKREENLIYTRHKIEISSRFKGSSEFNSVWLDLPGGQLGFELHKVTPAIELELNQEGIFLLEFTGLLHEGIPVYSPVAYSQGICRYSPGQLIDVPFEGSVQIDLFIQRLTSTYKLIPSTIRPLPSRNRIKIKQDQSEPMSNPVILSISPSVTTAGTGAVLTIQGNNFGRSPGSFGRVFFSNADDGGQSFVAASLSDIRFWSETLIQVAVPSRAGTGRIQVVNSSGIPVTSSTSLTVNFAILNYSNFFTGQSAPAELINQDGRGGITFQLASSFNQNTPAVLALRRAFESWRCGTGVNFSLSNQISTSVCSADDGINLINFDSQCRLSNGVLAATITRISGCFQGNNLFWQVKDVDILFSSQFQWNYGPQPTTGGRMDFETVAVHELGHAHQLGHIIAPGRVMHYSVGPNQDQRALEMNSDLAGGVAVMQRSESRSSCGTQAMRRLIGDQCRINQSTNQQPPVANFVVDRTRGCAPLLVRFFDSSTNNPTSWEWDINNDGLADYFLSSPQHTYTQPGTYSVRLTVRNAAGAASTVRWFLIQVDGPGTMTTTPTTASVCSGQSVSLSASGASSYSWAPVLSSTATNSTYVVSPNSSTTFTVTGFFANGCSSSRTVPVTVRPNPSLQVSSTPSNSIQAPNGRLTATALGGQPPYIFRLNFGPFTSQSIFTDLAPGSYTLTVRDANGCENQVIAQVLSAASAQCAAPVQLTASSVSTSGAILSWSGESPSNQFRVFFRRETDPSFQQIVSSSNSINLSGLLAGTRYFWYVQAVCFDRVSAPSATQDFTTQFTTPVGCLAPSIETTEITSSSIRVGWQVQPNVRFWQLYFRSTQTVSWNIVTVFAPSNHTVLSGLSPDTRYELYIRSDCGLNGVSPFAGPVFVNTLSPPASICNPPSNWQLTPFSSGINVSWSAVAGATGFRLSWREISSLNSVTAFTPASVLGYTIQNLVPGRTYEVSLTTLCGSATSSNRTSLVTIPGLGKVGSTSPSSSGEFLLYPNPGKGEFFLQVPQDWNQEPFELSIFDVYGKMVRNETYESPAHFIFNHTLFIDSLPAGIYVIECRSSGRRHVMRWIGI